MSLIANFVLSALIKALFIKRILDQKPKSINSFAAFWVISGHSIKDFYLCNQFKIKDKTKTKIYVKSKTRR